MQQVLDSKMQWSDTLDPVLSGNDEARDATPEPLVIRGFFHGAVAEDTSVGAQGQLHMLREMGSFLEQEHKGKYGCLTTNTVGHWQYMLYELESEVLGLVDGQTEVERFEMNVRNPHGFTIQHRFDVEITGTEDIPDINGIQLEAIDFQDQPELSREKHVTKPKAQIEKVGSEVESAKTDVKEPEGAAEQLKSDAVIQKEKPAQALIDSYFYL